MVPQVVSPLRLKGRVHADEARVARTHTTRKLKFTLPGPMTIIDTIEREQLKSDPQDFKPGDTVRVHVRVIDAERPSVVVEVLVFEAESGKYVRTEAP